MIKGFHHAAIVVPDLDRAKKFYEEVFGFTCVMELSWQRPNPVFDQITGVKDSAARGYLLRCNNAFLELFQYSSPAPSHREEALGANAVGIRHISFEVDDAVIEYARVKAAGGMTMNQPYVFPEGGSATYCRDPFGNIIELTTAGKGFPSINDA